MLGGSSLGRPPITLYHSTVENLCASELKEETNKLNSMIVKQQVAEAGHHHYAFHWCKGSAPLPLQFYRQKQRGAMQHGWEGLVAGTDGSVDLRADRCWICGGN